MLFLLAIAGSNLLLKMLGCMSVSGTYVCVESDPRAACALVNGPAPRVKSTYPSSARASTVTMVTAAPLRPPPTVSARHCSSHAWGTFRLNLLGTYISDQEARL